MRAGPASLQFDWSDAGLSMDFPVLVYSHMKTSLIFFQDREDVEQLFYAVKDLLTSNHAERTLQGFVFCLDLSMSRSTDHRGRNLNLLSDRFQSSCS